MPAFNLIWLEKCTLVGLFFLCLVVPSEICLLLPHLHLLPTRLHSTLQLLSRLRNPPLPHCLYLLPSSICLLQLLLPPFPSYPFHFWLCLPQFRLPLLFIIRNLKLHLLKMMKRVILRSPLTLFLRFPLCLFLEFPLCPFLRFLFCLFLGSLLYLFLRFLVCLLLGSLVCVMPKNSQ